MVWIVALVAAWLAASLLLAALLRAAARADRLTPEHRAHLRGPRRLWHPPRAGKRTLPRA